MVHPIPKRSVILVFNNKLSKYYSPSLSPVVVLLTSSPVVTTSPTEPPIETFTVPDTTFDSETSTTIFYPPAISPRRGPLPLHLYSPQDDFDAAKTQSTAASIVRYFSIWVNNLQSKYASFRSAVDPFFYFAKSFLRSTLTGAGPQHASSSTLSRFYLSIAVFMRSLLDRVIGVLLNASSIYVSKAQIGMFFFFFK